MTATSAPSTSNDTDAPETVTARRPVIDKPSPRPASRLTCASLPDPEAAIPARSCSASLALRTPVDSSGSAGTSAIYKACRGRGRTAVRVIKPVPAIATAVADARIRAARITTPMTMSLRRWAGWPGSTVAPTNSMAGFRTASGRPSSRSAPEPAHASTWVRVAKWYPHVVPAQQRRYPRRRTPHKIMRISSYVRSGAKGDRTPDLLLAKQALSQLSYGPRIPDCSPARTSSRPLRNGQHGDGCAPGALAVGSAPAASLPSRGKCRVARRRSPTMRRALVMRGIRRRGEHRPEVRARVAGRSFSCVRPEAGPRRPR